MKFPPLKTVESLPPVPSCEEDLEDKSPEEREKEREERLEEAIAEILSSAQLQGIIEHDEEDTNDLGEPCHSRDASLINMRRVNYANEELKIELGDNKRVRVKIGNYRDGGLDNDDGDDDDDGSGDKGKCEGAAGGDDDDDDDGVKMRKSKRMSKSGGVKGEMGGGTKEEMGGIKEEEEEEDEGDDKDKADAQDHSRFNFLSRAEELAKKIWAAGWMVVHHKHLPRWLKDNDFLIKGHRAPMHSYWRCFKSIFRVHTETGNIWTHLLGCIAFIAVAIYFNTRPDEVVRLQEKTVFSAFFFGAISCLLLSTTFHTVYCHSEPVGMLFNRLDYCGISMLTMGSFVPWLYYCFYCHPITRIVYTSLIFMLGAACIVVSMWQKFASATFRPVRAGVFIALGLSAVIPAMHYVALYGFWDAVYNAALGWLVLMAFLYIFGAVIYAVRIPERIWPGRFDIWCQSHQIFHIFVVIAAFIHYHGITIVASNRLAHGDCPSD